jgi:hypothetical protein
VRERNIRGLIARPPLAEHARERRNAYPEEDSPHTRIIISFHSYCQDIGGNKKSMWIQG